MKKILVFLTLFVFIFPVSCLSEEEHVLHFPFGLSETFTFFQAADKVENAIGVEKSFFTSPDNQYLHSCYFWLNGKSFLSVPVDYIRIIPVSDKNLSVSMAIRPDDMEALFSSIQIEFQNDVHFSKAFETVYNNLCIEFGEPDSKKFYVSEISLNGTEYINKDFPVDNAKAMSELEEVIDGANSYMLSASWDNARLSLSRYSASSLTLVFNTSTLF